ncbi:Platinum sensitivity protein, partial [Quaeritorhiza haematococci]
MMPEDFRGSSQFALPEPQLGNLKDIEQLLTAASRTIYGRDQLVQIVVQENYIDKLLPMLEVCEDLEATDDLCSLSNIMRSITDIPDSSLGAVFLNDSAIYDYILRDDIFLKVVGILEYDREFPNLKANHREHLIHNASFKQVVPIRNKEILAKIHQTYRVQFLKDVVLARLLDDGTFSMLNSLTFYNHVDIVNYFQQDHQFLNELFGILSSEETSMEKKKEVIMFLHELCGIAKTLQSQNRGNFYRSLGQHGLFAIFEYTLGDSDVNIRLAATAILSSILEHDPSLVRSFCLAQVKQGHQPLVEFLIDRFINEPDSGLRSQHAEILRILLDTSTSGMDGSEGLVAHMSQDSDADEFLNIFYEKYMSRLAQPVLSLDTSLYRKLPDGTTVLVLDNDKAAICHHICELLSFSIRHHSYRSKYFVLGSNVTTKVALLLKARDTYLRLSALRVFRTCIGLNDEFYIRHVLKHELFDPIMAAFQDTKSRYNLLNSACLELFEFIRQVGSCYDVTSGQHLAEGKFFFVLQENIKQLVAHVVIKYRRYFEEVDYVQTFTELIKRYEQNQETSKTNGDDSVFNIAPEEPKRAKDGWSRVDEDEEAYFNNDDNEDDPSTSSTTSSSSSSSTSSSSGGNAAAQQKVVESNSASSQNGLDNRRIEFVKASPLVDYPEEDDDDDDGFFFSGGGGKTAPSFGSTMSSNSKGINNSNTNKNKLSIKRAAGKSPTSITIVLSSSSSTSSSSPTSATSANKRSRDE